MSFYSVFQESPVEHFVVLDELVVKLRTPLDLSEAEGSWVDGVNNLAVDSARGTLFYFGELELQKELSIYSLIDLHRVVR